MQSGKCAQQLPKTYLSREVNRCWILDVNLRANAKYIAWNYYLRFSLETVKTILLNWCEQPHTAPISKFPIDFSKLNLRWVKRNDIWNQLLWPLCNWGSGRCASTEINVSIGNDWNINVQFQISINERKVAKRRKRVEHISADCKRRPRTAGCDGYHRTHGCRPNRYSNSMWWLWKCTHAEDRPKRVYFGKKFGGWMNVRASAPMANSSANDE